MFGRWWQRLQWRILAWFYPADREIRWARRPTHDGASGGLRGRR